MEIVLTFAVVVANILGAGMILPQVLKLQKTQSLLGVSAIGIGVGIAQNLWWVAYGVQAEGAFGIVPVSAAGTVLYSIMALQVLRIRGPRALGPIGGGFLGIGVIPLVPYLAIGLQAAGLTIGLLYGVQFAPAAATALRSHRLDGISASTWSMALGEALIWFAYGMHGSDAALTVGGAGGSLMAGVIVIRIAAVSPVRRRLAL